MIALVAAAFSLAATTGGLPRFPDVHDDTVVFTAGGDLWTVGIEGGTAQRLTNQPGVERFARISPDGQRVAFSAAYEGDTDVWTLPLAGGPAQRLTYHSTHWLDDLVWDWTPDGERVLFGSRHQAPDWRYLELYTVGLDGGLPERVLGSDTGQATYTPDGKLLFNRKFRNFRTWKRYRGGMQQDIWSYDPATGTSEQLTTFAGTDTHPLAHADGSVLFVSDRPDTSEEGGPAYSTRNLFRRAPDGTVSQLTTHTDFDVQWPALSGDRIVYMHGGDLRVLDLSSGRDVAMELVIPDEALAARTQREEWSGEAFSSSVGPQGKRVAVLAHGNLFTVPAEDGSWRAVVVGSEERISEVAWSPKGNDLAFVSDRDGEQQVFLVDQSGEEPARALTSVDARWIERLRWAPSGDRLSFVDVDGRLWDVSVPSGSARVVSQNTDSMPFGATYSHDGEWLAWLQPGANDLSAVWLYDVRAGEAFQVTDGFSDDAGLAFDPEGRWLFLSSRRNYDLVTDTFEHRMVHRLTDQLYAFRLAADGDDPVPLLSDEEVEDDGTPDVDPEPEEERRRERRRRRRRTQEVVPDAPRVRIDREGLAERLVRLPIEAGRYSQLAATEDGLFFLSSPGIDDGSDPCISVYKHEDQQVHNVVCGPAGFDLAAGQDKLLTVDSSGRVYITDARADAGRGERVGMGGLSGWVEPRQEWAGALDETRRYLRDHFYDPEMHGHDWDALHDTYAALLDRAADPSDVSWLVGEYISELNVGHAYSWEGWDGLYREDTGKLGADLAAAPGGVRIARILRGEPGRDDRSSPLTAPGVDVREGDYLLAIDGHTLQPGDNPHRWLAGTAGRPIRLSVSSAPSGARVRDVVVTPLHSDRELRYWEWVEDRRHRVAEATDGRVGYVHVPNTSQRGYTEFVRGLHAQHHLDGLVIDVRYNGGGFIPEMFIEPLLRPLYNTWVPRQGSDWRTPSIAVHGPKVMLTNGYAGSGGDAFPYYFRQFELGPLVGETTWGGLVGITGSHDLLIGGGITAPSFAFVNRDGEWDVERVGVAPDRPVINLPEDEDTGRDPQLDAALGEILSALESWTSPVPARPPRYPQRP